MALPTNGGRGESNQAMRPSGVCAHSSRAPPCSFEDGRRLGHCAHALASDDVVDELMMTGLPAAWHVAAHRDDTIIDADYIDCPCISVVETLGRNQRGLEGGKRVTTKGVCAPKGRYFLVSVLYIP